MEGSLFAKLPAELRNAIYELVFTQAAPITMETPDHFKHKLDGLRFILYETVPSLDKHAFALQPTCRRIHEECSTLFFAINEFVMCSPTFACTTAFLENIGTANAAAITSLTLEYGLATRGRMYSLERRIRAAQELARELPGCNLTVMFTFESWFALWVRSVVLVKLGMGDLERSWVEFFAGLDERIKGESNRHLLLELEAVREHVGWLMRQTGGPPLDVFTSQIGAINAAALRAIDLYATPEITVYLATRSEDWAKRVLKPVLAYAQNLSSTCALRIGLPVMCRKPKGDDGTMVLRLDARDLADSAQREKMFVNELIRSTNRRPLQGLVQFLDVLPGLAATLVFGEE